MGMRRMIGLIVFGCLLGSTAIAGNEECSGIGPREAYNSLDVHGLKACFVYTKVSVKNERTYSRDPDGVSLYSVISSENPKLVYELPYAGTEGAITDAFFFQLLGRPKKCSLLSIAWKRQDRGIR